MAVAHWFTVRYLGVAPTRLASTVPVRRAGAFATVANYSHSRQHEAEAAEEIPFGLSSWLPDTGQCLGFDVGGCPVVVLGDLLGIGMSTATRWSGRARRV